MTAQAMVEAAKSNMEYRPRDAKSSVLVKKERRLFVDVAPGQEKAAELLEIESILNLEPGLGRYEMTVANRGGRDPLKGPSPPAKELRVVPRSTAQAMYFLSNGVEVPKEHLCAGLVTSADTGGITNGLFTVHSCGGHKPPADAFVAIRHRGHWYYIDDRDRESKTTFALMFHMAKLDFTREALRGPALTLPVGK